MHGKPSSAGLRAAGVLVRQMDVLATMSAGARVWGVSEEASTKDRIVGSVVNRLTPFMYSTSAIGFVFAPSDIHSAIRCSYPKDAGSVHIEGGCDGSAYPGEAGLASMMNEQTYGHARWGSSKCLWGSAVLEDRSGCRYNEVVIDAPSFASHLPHVVEAFFYPVNAPRVGAVEGDAATARLQHAEFLRIYGSRVEHEPPPLLEFDVQRARGGHEPFRVATNARAVAAAP